MEESLLLLISLIFLVAFLYLLDFSHPDAEACSSDSETHARKRYAVAREIEKELKRQ